MPTDICEMPAPYAPDYDAWRVVFEQSNITPETSAVGHSAGAGFILRWLSENPGIELDYVGLVALWHDETHRYGAEFFNYTFDPGIADRVGKIAVFHSLDDSPGIQLAVNWLLEQIPTIDYHEFSGHGHFMLGNNMDSQEFPELLDDMVIYLN